MHRIDGTRWQKMQIKEVSPDVMVRIKKAVVQEKDQKNVSTSSDNRKDILLLAAQFGDLETVKYYIEEEKINVNSKGIFQKNPLFLAAQYGRLDVVKYLAEKGADVRSEGTDHKTPVMVAAHCRHLQVVKYLVEERRVDVNEKNNSGATALHYAASNSLVETVKYLIEDRKADINVKDKIYDDLPLQKAVKHGNLDVVKYLHEEKGADLCVVNADGQNLLHLTTTYHDSSLDLVQYLVSHCKIDVNLKDNEGNTPLHLAAHRGDDYQVKYLIEEKKADINQKNNKGETFLDVALDASYLKNVIEKLKLMQEVKSTITADIFEAAKTGDLNSVRYWVEEKRIDVNFKDSKNVTPLIAACEYGHLAVVKYLVEKKADVHAEQESALQSATTRGHLDVIKYLVEEKGSRVKISSELRSYSLLHLAASGGHVNVMKYLVDEKKVSIDSIGIADETPLYLAAQAGKTNAVKYLAEKGAKIDYMTSHYFSNNTPLLVAARESAVEVVKYLVKERKADVRKKSNSDGRTALDWAIENGSLEIVKCIIEDGKVDVNEKLSSGLPVQKAAENGYLNIVKYFVEEKGADVNVVSGKGENLLHLATNAAKITDTIDLVKYLTLQSKINVNATNADGNTPLHLAASNDKIRIVKYLVEEGKADINAKNKKDKSPLNLAPGELSYLEPGDKVKYYLEGFARPKQITMAADIFEAAKTGDLNSLRQWVEEKKIDVNSRNSSGRTALHNAAQSGALEAVKYLIEYGKADMNVKDTCGEIPLQSAAKYGHINVVKYLHEEKGGDVNVVNKQGENLLHLAVDYYADSVDLVRYLVSQCKLDPNAKTLEGNTPLHLAANSANINIVNYLLREKRTTIPHLPVDLTEMSPYFTREEFNRQVPADILFPAAESGDLDKVKYWVEEKGTDVNIERPLKKIPLHSASEYGQLAIVKYLVEKGANLNARQLYQYETPLQLAGAKGHLDIVKYIVDEKGVDLKGNNSLGNSLLPLAIKNGRSDIVKFLVDEKKIDGNDYSKAEEYLKSISKPRRTRRKAPETTLDLDYPPLHNSAGKHSFFISSVVYWLSNSFTKFLLPPPSQVKDSVPYPEVSSSLLDGFLVLLNVGIRRFSGSYYKQPVHDSLLSPNDHLLRRIDPVALSVVGSISQREIRELSLSNALQNRSMVLPFWYPMEIPQNDICGRNNIDVACGSVSPAYLSADGSGY